MKTRVKTTLILPVAAGLSMGGIAFAEQPQLDSTLERILNSVETVEGTPSVDLQNPSNNPENVQRVMRLVSAEDFDFFFPQAAAVYTYESFLTAIAKFPAFCNEAADMSIIEEVCAQELATVFAHFTQETGGHNVHDEIPEWRQGLYHITEMGCSDTGSGCEYRGGTCQEGTWQAAAWPCAEGQKYYGRGAKQLSYNYNYGQFSDVMFGDVNVLLEAPNRVATEGWLAISSAIWFAMTPQTPKPSIHEIVTGFWQPNERDKFAGIEPGFGATTLVINGGIECGGSVEHAASANRIAYYTEFAKAMGIDPGENLGCAGYNSFPAGGAGAVMTYWEKDWGQPGACKLVSYQTAYSVFKEEDYENCVAAMWGQNTTDTNSTIETTNHGSSEAPTKPSQALQTAEDYESDCAIVTSWWPEDCGLTTSGKICDRGWGTFDSIEECCDSTFPDNKTCGVGTTEEFQETTPVTGTTEQENAAENQLNNGQSTEQNSQQTEPATGECYSVVSHISDSWCQTVACDQVYIDAGFCAVTE